MASPWLWSHPSCEDAGSRFRHAAGHHHHHHRHAGDNAYAYAGAAFGHLSGRSTITIIIFFLIIIVGVADATPRGGGLPRWPVMMWLATAMPGRRSLPLAGSSFYMELALKGQIWHTKNSLTLDKAPSLGVVFV
jgi:hypothetical protein